MGTSKAAAEHNAAYNVLKKDNVDVQIVVNLANNHYASGYIIYRCIHAIAVIQQMVLASYPDLPAHTQTFTRGYFL